MRITQGTFSHLPDLTDEEIKMQVQYMLNNGWAVSLEYTDDPHPRNVYWEMFGLPMFDANDPSAVLYELAECRRVFPYHYIRLNGYDRQRGSATTRLSFIVNRPRNEPGFHIERQEFKDRRIQYTLRAYATDLPSGQRYDS